VKYLRDEGVFVDVRIWVSLAAFGLLGGCASEDRSSAEAQSETQQRLSREAEAFAGWSLDRLMTDPAAAELGASLFSAHCASCHGHDARGAEGVPDLVEGVFDYGADENAVRSTLVNGRQSVMPALGRQLGEVEIGQIVAFVQSLTSEEPLSTMAERGAELFGANCGICHGADAAGIAEFGTPSLLDDYWVYGDSMMSIRLAIARGREAQCPPQSETLSVTEIELLTAFVMAANEPGSVAASAVGMGYTVPAARQAQ
jgi:cytochrome c oxidase cbb3-type subunit 3